MNDLGAGGDLHQQLDLREQLRQSLDGWSHRGLLSVAEAVNAVWPLVSAAVAAAQADTAERIAEAIEAEMVEDRAVGRVTVGGVTPWERCAALARSVGVPETELK